MTFNSARGWLLAGTCGVAMVSGVAMAQTTATNGASETVVVTGNLESQIPAMLSQYGTQVDTIQAKAIKNGGYVDAAQILADQAPGLYLNEGHGNFDYVSVSYQGSRTQDVLWAVDGVRLNNRLYAGTTPLDTIPASMIERIELIQGGESLFYGTQATAGVVNIITKEFTDTFDSAVTAGANSNYGAHADGYMRDKLWGGQFVVFASMDELPGYRSYPHEDYQPTETMIKRGYHNATGGAKYQVAVEDDLKITASYEKSLGHLDSPSYAKVRTAYNQRSEDLLTTKLDYEPTDFFQFYVKGYSHWWISHFTSIQNTAAGGINVLDNHDHWGYVDQGVNAMAQIRFMPGLTSELGYDFQKYNGNDAVLVIAPQSENVHAVFGQLQAEELIPRTHLAAGFRYNMPSVGQSAFIWNVSGKVDITEGLYFKAMTGTNFRLPTAEELFANDPDDELGNPDLRPERSYSANAAVGGQLNLGAMVNWQLTGFYRAIANAIALTDFNAVTNQDVFGNTTGKMITRGAEVTANVPFTDYLSADGDITYNSARQTGSKLQVNQIPEFLFKLGADYHPACLPFGLSVNLQNIGDINNTVSGIGRIDYGNYTLVNMGMRVFLDEARNHRIGFNVSNITDEDYYAPGRGTSVAGNTYLVHLRGQPRTAYLTYTWSIH